MATRSAERYGDDLAGWIQYGASPRASMALDRCARAYAWLNKRDFVTPEDIQLIAPDVLRHRIILSFEAEAEGMTTDNCIDEILSRVSVP
jgi:MoxR-like ATPase